jgi:MarC family membrane protein
MLTSLWLGRAILGGIGISIGAFSIAGGIVLFGIGLGMLNSKSGASEKEESNEVNIEVGREKTSPAVVPLAIPISAGPGVITALLVAAHANEAGVQGLLALSIACVAMAAMMALVFWYAPALGRLLGPSGIQISTQIMGLIVAAIASQMVLNGLKSAAPMFLSTINDPGEVEFNPAILWQCKDPKTVVKPADFSDPRIKAIIAVNPVSNPAFTAAAIQTLRSPVLIVSGTADVFAPPVSQQLMPYSSVVKAANVLAVFDKATHLSFLAATGKLPEWLIGPDPEQAQRDLKALSLAFFDQQLLGKETMGALVPSNAALYRAGQPLQFLLRRQLTPGELRAIAPNLSPATQ